MSATKITESAYLRSGWDRTGNDPFQRRTRPVRQGFHHRVTSFSQRKHEHPIVRLEVVEIFTHAQHAALAVNVPRKALAD